jgi:hypothetical protein
MASHAHSQPLFDLFSFARRGPGRRDHVSPGEIQQVARTVRRTPEVMVKVLSRGGQDLKAVGRHIDYLRHREDGEIDVETDDGFRQSGEEATKEMMADWDLELEAYRSRSILSARAGGSQKLVHKVIFSMPSGTPPKKVLAAVRNLAREEFGLKHRYAMVLHTDEPHPHVHMVLKAVSEHGIRLHIRKQTLRHWRQEFARQLRVLGVEANATERTVRGEARSAKKDGIYRASLRGESTYVREQAEAVARELMPRDVREEQSKSKLVETRNQVRRGWIAVSEILLRQGQPELSAEARRFAHQMLPPMTERELLARALVEHRRPARVREGPGR